MNAPRQTKHLLERRHAEVIGWLIEGKTVGEVAKLVSTKRQQVSSQAVCAFRKRHAAELGPLVAEVEKQITDYAIASKVNRIKAMDQRWHLLESVRQARAKGETGEETGLVVRQYKALGSGKFMQVVEEWKIDPALLAAMAELERDAAEELGQLNKDGEKATAVATVVNIIRNAPSLGV